MGKISINPETRIACGDCLKVCPSIFLPEGEGIRIVEGACTLCGHCLAVCPAEAIDHAASLGAAQAAGGPLALRRAP